MVNILKHQFQYFYKKTFNKQKVFSVIELNHIEFFDQLLKKEYKGSIGEDWVFNYLAYQFNKYSQAKTKLKTIQVTWIYSGKSLIKYKNRNIESDYFNSEFCKKFKINKRRLVITNELTLSKDYKNNERKRFNDINRQLLHCFELDLFEENNKVCMFCKNKNYCIKL